MMGEINSVIPKYVTLDKSTAEQTADPAHEKKLKKACADFEAIFVFQLLKTMRQSVPRNGILKPSQGRETYEMMLDQKIAEELAHKGEGLGLQKMLYNQITQHDHKKELKSSTENDDNSGKDEYRKVNHGYQD
jgi:peptidoglycan hydrolase FlgJ